MERAAQFLGHDKAMNSHMHLGHRGHILTFPVAKGTVMNVVAFKYDSAESTDVNVLNTDKSPGKTMENGHQTRS